VTVEPTTPDQVGPTTTQHRWRWRGDVPPDERTRIGTVQTVAPDDPRHPIIRNRYRTVVATRTSRVRRAPLRSDRFVPDPTRVHGPPELVP
jgi:hypothetical protein